MYGLALKKHFKLINKGCAHLIYHAENILTDITYQGRPLSLTHQKTILKLS